MSVSRNSSTATSQANISPIPASAEPFTQHNRPTPSVTPHAPHHSQQQQHPQQQQQQQQQQQEEEEWLVACRCENGKALLTLLSCLQHISEGHHGSESSSSNHHQTQSGHSRSNRSKKHQIQPVTVFCSPSTFTFHVFGPAKQSEATIELQKAMFTQYQVLQPKNNNSNNNNNTDSHEEDETEDWQAGGEFCVNLTTVLESLQLLGSLEKTKVLMTYNLQQEIFKLELLQDDTGVICTAAIPGLNTPEDTTDGDSLTNAFRAAPLAVRMLVRSGILRDLLPEWSNVAGASCVSVAISHAKGLEIAVLGHYGECWVQVPPTGDHLVSELDMANPKETVTRTYPLHSLLTSMKGLEIAEETCININANGIMAIQHKTEDPTGNGCSNYVDFIMTCLEDEEDEDEEGEGDGEETTTQMSASQGTFRTWDRHATTERQQHQQSPAETTTTRATRRRPRKQKSPTQDEEDNVAVQGTSDMEDDADTPRSRQKRQSRQTKKQRKVLPMPPPSDEDDEEDDDPPPISAGPLFGTVVREPTATSSTTPPRRRQRRLSASNDDTSQRQATKNKRKNPVKKNDEDSDASKDLLADTSEEEKDENESSSDDEQEEVLDITALAGSPAGRASRRTDEECSSPELIYGKQS